MTVGMEFARSSDGMLLIAPGFYNPRLAAAGSVATVANTYTSDGLGSIAILPNSGPIKAIDLPSGHKAHVLDNVTYWTDCAVGTSIPYFIFDEISYTPIHVGVEIYDNSGNILFNTGPGSKPLRLAGEINSGSGIFAVPSGKRYVVAHGTCGITYQWQSPAQDGGGSPDPSYYALIRFAAQFSVSSSGIFMTSGLGHRIDPPAFSTFGTTSPDYSQEGIFGASNALILDVTDY